MSLRLLSLSPLSTVTVVDNETELSRIRELLEISEVQ